MKDIVTVPCDADSGMSGEAVAQAEMFWSNLPTGNRPWTSLQTSEKALVCHVLARHRLAALGEAAKVADHFWAAAEGDGLSEEVVMARAGTAYDIATDIRALSTPPTKDHDHAHCTRADCAARRSLVQRRRAQLYQRLTTAHEHSRRRGS